MEDFETILWEQDQLIGRIESNISETNLTNLEKNKLMDTMQEIVENAFIHKIEKSKQ